MIFGTLRLHSKRRNLSAGRPSTETIFPRRQVLSNVTAGCKCLRERLRSFRGEKLQNIQTSESENRSKYSTRGCGI